MPHMLVYDQSRQEISQIRDWVCAVYTGKEELFFHSASNLQDLLLQLSGLNEVTFCCADFEADGERAVCAIRECDNEALIVIIASPSTPPQAYIQPQIMAAGLLLRPLTRAQAIDMLRQVVDASMLRLRRKMFNNEIFSFSTREGMVRIPYSQILYFEARNKKIILCTGRKELEFYSTLESLVQKLPDYFLRCHKGFIINKYLVTGVDAARTCLHLVDGFQVPISRSCRKAVMEALA